LALGGRPAAIFARRLPLRAIGIDDQAWHKGHRMNLLARRSVSLIGIDGRSYSMHCSFVSASGLIRGQKALGELQTTSGTRFETPTKIRQRRETHIVNDLMPDFSHGLIDFCTRVSGCLN
jgi:hypothetical protein